jgi:hypothetical protein
MQKKLALLGAVAAALIVATPANAQSGHVQGTWQNTDAGGGSDFDSMSVSGSVALGSNFQVDAGWGTIDDADVDGFMIGGHLFNRNDQWRWGGYAGFSNLESGGSDLDETTVALQTQYYMERTTVSGNLLYSTADAGGGSDLDTIGLTGELRHFATDNFSLQANAGFGQVDASGTDGDLWTAGVGAEWRLTNTPFSVYGGWQHFDVEGSDADSLGIGVRLAFGEDSLYARNRSGAGLSRPGGFFDGLFGVFGPAG